jgi:hypothetical protein
MLNIEWSTTMQLNNNMTYYLGCFDWINKNNDRLHAYSSFIQHKSPKIICSLEVAFFSCFDTRISFIDLELAYWRSFVQQNL